MKPARLGRWILFPAPLGWFGLAWLGYLLIPPATLAIEGAPLWQWALQIGGTIAMLLLYVLGFQSRGGIKNTLVVAGMASLGVTLSVLVTPGNWGMLVYAAGFAGIRRRFPEAISGVLAVMACIGLLFAFHYIQASSAIAGLLLATSVGLGNSIVARNIELNARLRDAKTEIELLAALAERERIGRDLHDVLGQTLSAIVLKSELAGRVAATNTDRALAEIAGVENAAREALAQLRSVVSGYRGAGLHAEIERARAILTDAGIVLESPDVLPPVTLEQERTLSLILREAVTNVVRHSRATRCWIELGEKGGELILTVRDDGRGIVGGMTGSGVTGMKERAAEMNGVCEIAGATGVTVRVRIPGAPSTTVR